MANWAELPNDLIAQIANRVEVIEDYIALRAVCTSWRSAATKENFDVFSPQVPLLILVNKDDDYSEFYSLSKEKALRIFVPEARGRKRFPFEGWLCTVEDSTGEMNLLHPFTRTQIQLPSEKAFLALADGIEGRDCRSINKVVLSVSPFMSDYVLVVSDGRYMAFWRPGDLDWTEINSRNFSSGISCMKYCKGKFYVVCCTGKIYVVDVAQPGVPSTSIVKPRLLVEYHRLSNQFYLVEVSGALLLVELVVSIPSTLKYYR